MIRRLPPFALLLTACAIGTGTGEDAAIISADAGPGIDAGPGVDAGPGDTDAGIVEGCGNEMCDNGLDDDCDGDVDEQCPCVPGEQAPCFRGPASARGQGMCADGSMTCQEGLEFGTWGECLGDTLPAEEACDAAGGDEDCDGASNEGCECEPGSTSACGSDVGACTPGTQECVDGHLGDCVGQIEPAAETCNDADDDCDGSVDENITQPCGTDTGECAMGTQTCVAGVFDVCEGGQGAVAEICDGLDNDCDGTADEGLTQGCGSDVGECSMGTQTCSGGRWSMCSGGTTPAVETCDNLDQDCDGRIDEGVTRACGSSVGICRPGTETCTAGVFGACTGGTAPGTEVCDGMRDEDCDGTVDEMCGCTTGAMRSCGTDTGQCVAGTQTCDATGNWGSCTGMVGPVPEICNRLDDDCDGMSDEGGVCPTAPPVVMCPGAMSAEVLSTVSLAGGGSDPDGGTVTYRWTVMSAPSTSRSQPLSPASASTNFYLDASGNYVLQLCVTDDEGEMACCTTAINSIAPGALHVELSWNTVYGDVDLHLLNVTRSDPNGWFTVDDCHWRNRTPDWGPVGAVANPTLDIDDTDGYGPENTTIDNAPASGTYTVGLHYYCQHSIGGGSIGMGDGPTQATVRVFCDGNLIATYSGLNLAETDDWLTVAEVDYPSCVGRSRSRRTNGSSILPSSLTREVHCEIPCSADSDCPTGERCLRVGGGGPPRYACIFQR